MTAGSRTDLAALDRALLDTEPIEDDAPRPRVERRNRRKAHREYPHSRTSHQVSNVRSGAVTGIGEGAALPVTALFTGWRFGNGTASHYVGTYRDQPVVRSGAPRIRGKRGELGMTEPRPAGDLAMIR